MPIRLFNREFNRDHLIKLLWGVNILSVLGAFCLGAHTNFPDAHGYLRMSEGIFHGRFSSWYFLNPYYPETLRTPGYPVFLALCRVICNSVAFIKGIQLCLYFATLYLIGKILVNVTEAKNALIIFLMLTAVNIQIPYYAGYISSECLNTFFITLYTYLQLVKKRNWKNAILIGLSAGAVYELRPVFLLFPYFLVAASVLFRRSNIRYVTTQALVFTITLLPFAFWNLRDHGVFKPTPIEGGAGVAHLGYWSFKLPHYYEEPFYWYNNMGYDITNPICVNDSVREQNKVLYEQEWREINKQLSIDLVQPDYANLEIMAADTQGVFLLHNSKYTLHREKLLWHYLFKHIKEDPWFYLKTRVYTFFRSYFTGIDYQKYHAARSWLVKLSVVFPFAVTFTCILGGLIFSSIYFIKHWLKLESGMNYLFLISLYYGLIHIPFAVQARYTVPIHLFLLVFLSVIISNYFYKSVKKTRVYQTVRPGSNSLAGESPVSTSQ